MKARNDRAAEKSPCSVKISPAPEFFTCPKCGYEIELWTDEEDTSCDFCGHRIFRKERTVH